jgi:hypothetical protein
MDEVGLDELDVVEVDLGEVGETHAVGITKSKMGFLKIKQIYLNMKLLIDRLPYMYYSL